MSAERYRRVHIDADRREPFGSTFDTPRFSLRDFASGLTVGAILFAIIAALMSVPC